MLGPAGSGAAPAPPAAAPFRTELVVRVANNLRSHAEVVAFVERASRHGVAAINLGVKQDEDDEVPSGTVFYASSLAPRAPGYESFDVLRAMLDEAHRRGIKVRAWIPQFHDQVAARKDAGWQMQALVGRATVPFTGKGGTEYFVNPLDPAVQAYQRAIVEEVARGYDVDGIVLDWLRFDDYNMDMGPQTRARFRQAHGYDPADIDLSSDNPRRTQWNAWRSAGIAAYVASVRTSLDALKPGLELGVYILPPEFLEVGQDAALFAGKVSFLSPMAYYKDWGLTPAWVYGELLAGTQAKARGAAVVPTLDTHWDDAAYREILPGVRQRHAGIVTLSWFTYGAWTEAILQRIDRLRTW